MQFAFQLTPSAYNYDICKSGTNRCIDLSITYSLIGRDVYPLILNRLFHYYYAEDLKQYHLSSR
jgi:hypothetical protein